MIPSLGKHVEQMELSCTAYESVNWYNHFGKSLAVSFEAKQTPPCDLAGPPVGIYPRKMNVYVLQTLVQESS